GTRRGRLARCSSPRSACPSPWSAPFVPASDPRGPDSRRGRSASPLTSPEHERQRNGGRSHAESARHGLDSGRGPGQAGAHEPRPHRREHRRREHPEDAMRYERISADCHIDLCQLPPDLFTSNAPAALKDRMPYVTDSPKGKVWVSKNGGYFGYAG